MAELDFLRWIRNRLGKRRGRIVVDSGDDTAVVRFGSRNVLFKTDSIVDGVHFDSRTARPEAIGHKAIARALSDVAAMGCSPVFAVAAMVVPFNTREQMLRGIFRGMERTAGRFKTLIVGGDMASHRGKLIVNVSLLGEPTKGSPICRDGARPGDVLAVTGPLGGSILGKHLTFTPRIREGLELNRRFDVRAMIDLSDGVSIDLRHVCNESGVGAVLDEARIPISAAARRLARKDRRSALQHALGDGEDYELLFAIPAGQAARLRKSKLGRVIGEVCREKGVKLRRSDGSIVNLPKGGWTHRFD